MRVSPSGLRVSPSGLRVSPSGLRVSPKLQALVYDILWRKVAESGARSVGISQWAVLSTELITLAVGVLPAS